jgi:hypothetical protein
MCGGHFVRMLVPVVTGSVEQATRSSTEARAVSPHVPCPTCGAATMPEFTVQPISVILLANPDKGVKRGKK